MKKIELEIPGFYSIIPMKEFRRTPGVEFHILTKENTPRVDGVDRVIHKSDAQSPGPVGDVLRPWYTHPHQEDNLIVLYGKRIVDVYHRPSRTMMTFTVTPDYIEYEGEVIYDKPAILVWKRNVFHRIISGKEGSASLNLATRYEGFDVKTNFSIYDLDTETGKFHVIRKGELDQF